LLDEAIELLNSLEHDIRCEKIMILLNDAIRAKSVKSLNKVTIKNRKQLILMLYSLGHYTCRSSRDYRPHRCHC